MEGMANFCCMCDCEIPVQPNKVRSGYCSEKCWQQWIEEHKNDAILYPYVPLQVTKIKLNRTIETAKEILEAAKQNYK